MRNRVGTWKDRFAAAFGRARGRSRLVDRLVRSVRHYQAVQGTQLAAAATYFGFLSFFPLVALSFAAVGYVVAYVPGADHAVAAALSELFPGLVGAGPDQVDVRAIARRRAGVGIVGLVVLLYTGLGWISALRASLHAVFCVEEHKRPNLVVGKAYDLVVLAVVGVVLVASVGLGTAMTAFTRTVVAVAGLGELPGAGGLLVAAGLLVGLAIDVLLFCVLYRLLSAHTLSLHALVAGALLAGIGFEIIKQLAGVVIGRVTENALYGAFAVMVALLVWINYFDRLAVFGAAWALMSERESAPADEEPSSEEPAPVRPTDTSRVRRRGRLAVGGAVGIAGGVLGVGWLVRRRRRARASRGQGSAVPVGVARPSPRRRERT